jgi:hypothetical protein
MLDSDDPRHVDTKLLDDDKLENVTCANAGRAVIGCNHQPDVIHPTGMRTNLESIQLTEKAKMCELVAFTVPLTRDADIQLNRGVSLQLNID